MTPAQKAQRTRQRNRLLADLERDTATLRQLEAKADMEAQDIFETCKAIVTLGRLGRSLEAGL
jgi:hypothetical protein